VNEVLKMDRKTYVYWQEEDMWLGYLEEYPDYKTQGESLDELKENLRDIYHELSSGNIHLCKDIPGTPGGSFQKSIIGTPRRGALDPGKSF
jgi:hypothetical protein